jgi:hypothetical protein
MKIISVFRPIAAIAMLILIPFVNYAQETKKEVHIKIIENGIVTKDTVYSTTGESPEIEKIVEMEEQEASMGKKHRVEKCVIVMSDSLGEDSEEVMEYGRQKQVKVIVHSGDEEGGVPEVEDVWIESHGKPCHTIIIHEGDCPGGKMEMHGREMEGDHMEHMMPPAPPAPPVPPTPGSKNVEKKIIRTSNGDKVIIIETTDEGSQKGKDKNKK